MDPKTGAILALANYPTFDPIFQANQILKIAVIMEFLIWLNQVRLFKLVTAIAALEENVVDFNEIFETPDNGEINIHGLTLRDHDPLGDIHFEEIIRQSSNIAMAELAMGWIMINFINMRVTLVLELQPM